MIEIMEIITLPWHSLPPFRVCKDRPCSVNGNTLSSPNLSLTQANCQSTSVTCKCFYVVSCLVARFAIVPKKQIIQGSNNFWKVHCCGKKSWETIFLNKMFEWKNIAFFLEKSCLSAVPKKKIRPLIKPWLMNIFYTNFQGTGPWEGPIHFSMFFSGFIIYNNCSKFFQSWSWSQEKKGRPLPKAIAKFKAQAFPKRIRPLIKPWLMNIFYTNFQGTGPWEGPIHFSMFVLRVHNL